MSSLTAEQRQLLGLESSGLVATDAGLMDPEAAEAFARLAAAAKEQGFELRVASAHRSFARQLLIWNGKLRGERPVCDEHDQPIDLQPLTAAQRVEAVLRFSALPGTSRHHWGTDVDVFDAAAVADDYCLQLNAAEVAADGCFARMHEWLDARIARGESYGFYRPYDRDRGGVAPERWHLSYAPRAADFTARLTARLLLRGWDEGCTEDELVLRPYLAPRLEEILERYVQRVALAPR